MLLRRWCGLILQCEVASFELPIVDPMPRRRRRPTPHFPRDFSRDFRLRSHEPAKCVALNEPAAAARISKKTAFLMAGKGLLVSQLATWVKQSCRWGRGYPSCWFRRG